MLAAALFAMDQVRSFGSLQHHNAEQRQQEYYMYTFLSSCSVLFEVRRLSGGRSITGVVVVGVDSGWVVAMALRTG